MLFSRLIPVRITSLLSTTFFIHLPILFLTKTMEHISFSLDDFDIRIGLLVFLAYLITDALYVFYMYLVVKKDAARAASVGAIMYFLVAFGIINYVNNFLYVIPIVAGSWLGTYLVVRREKNKTTLI